MIENTICLLNDSFPPQIDGVANAVVNYADYICRSGKHAVVITPDHPHADDGQFGFPVVRYRSVNFAKRKEYMVGLPFSPKIAKETADQKISLIHAHCPIVSTYVARELRQIADAPIVLTYHTKFDVDIKNVTKNKILQSACQKALVSNINACDEVWAVSRGAGENLRALGYEGDYIVMPNGVDLPRERVGEELVVKATAGWDLPSSVPVYLFVGRMMWYKGIKIILDALAMLHARKQDFRMVFVGDGHDKKEIQQYAGSIGIGDRCIFAGSVTDRQELRAWYCRGDLFLFPSVFDTNGLVVREAAANALASVLIEGSAASEGIVDGRNGFLISEDPGSLCRLLQKLHADPSAAKSVGHRASEEIYFSWEDAVHAALSRYEIVLDRYHCGQPIRQHSPSESLMKMNGELMEALGKLSSFRGMWD